MLTDSPFTHKNPVVAYRARRLLAGEPETSPAMRKLRRTIGDSEIFRISRNPMCVGFDLLTLSAVLKLGHRLLLVLGVYSIVVCHLIILGEEAYLASVFGEANEARMQEPTKYHLKSHALSRSEPHTRDSKGRSIRTIEASSTSLACVGICEAVVGSCAGSLSGCSATLGNGIHVD